MSEAVLALDVGGTTIKAEVVATDGQVLDRDRVDTGRGAGAVAAVADLGAALLRRTAVPIVAAGVVVPGLVDPGRGVARFASNLGWRDVTLAVDLTAHWGLPVRVAQDVAAAAAAELRVGAARGASRVAVVVVGTGLAAALTVDGRILFGAGGAVAEIGHLPVPGGTDCPCGRTGCAETVASARAVVRRYAEAGGPVAHDAGQVIDRVDVDPRAARVWSEAVVALADVLTTLCLVATPRSVVIGGGLAEAGSALLDPLRRHLAERAGDLLMPPEIRRAELGSRAGVVGAALLARGDWDGAG